VRLSFQSFKTQIQPLVSRIEQEDIARLIFAQGQIEASAPPDFERYFGFPPYYAFVNFREPSEMGEYLRNLPEGEEHEDTMKPLASHMISCSWDRVVDAMSGLFQIMEADPEIQVRISCALMVLRAYHLCC
jgi:hypothetical protein